MSGSYSVEVDANLTLRVGESDGPMPGPGPSIIADGEALERYVVLERVGKGGMGDVYLAYDTKLRREIALKVIRPDDEKRSAEAEVRLLREAQAMAQLNHPNVVPVYDVENAGGKLYITMEYVPGQTLDEWRRETDPSLDEIRRVFVEAGKGLEAAHDCGLVHRDFKPTNVMIGEDGRARVMDFGLARGTEDASEALGEPELQKLLESFSTSITMAGTVLGTPVYMAPEQQLGGAITPGSDQFAFCVALYETLFGKRPFDAADFRGLAKAKAAGKVSIPTGTNVPTWIQAIVLRGLAADSADRWPSMQALTDRLALDPAVQRRRVAGLVSLTVATFGSIAVAYYLAASGPEVCSGAPDAIASTWNPRAKTRVEAAFVDTGVPFARDTWARVEEHLDRYTEDWVQGHRAACEATALRREQSGEVMDRRMACLRQAQEELAATLDSLATQTDGDVVAKAVQVVSRLPPLEHCKDIEALMESVPPPGDPQVEQRVIEARRLLATVAAQTRLGRGEEAVEDMRALLEREDEIDFPPLFAEVTFWMGSMLEVLGRYEESVEHFEDSYFRAVECRHDEFAAEASARLLFVHGYRLGHDAEADSWVAHSRAVAGRLGDLVARSRHHSGVGAVLLARGQMEEASRQYERAIELREEVSDPMDFGLAAMVNNYATSLVYLGRRDEAETQFRRALEITVEALGARNPQVTAPMMNIANIALQREDYEEAHAQYARVLELRSQLLGDDHPEVAAVLNNMCVALQRADRLDEAENKCLRALQIREKQLGWDHRDTGLTLNNLASVHYHRGEHAKALEIYERALEIYEDSLEPDHAYVGHALDGVASNLLALGRIDEGRPILYRSVDILRRSGSDSTELAQVLLKLADLAWGDGQRDAAVGYATESQKVATQAGAQSRVREAEQWLRDHG